LKRLFSEIETRKYNKKGKKIIFFHRLLCKALIIIIFRNIDKNKNNKKEKRKKVFPQVCAIEWPLR
jgi:hypothetical protein